MTRNFDVIVAGAGIVGVSTALHLQMRGLKVGLIDRRGAGLETSFGNAGVIGYVLPFGFPSDPQTILNVALDRDTSARIRYGSLPRYLPWLMNYYLQSRPKQHATNGRLLQPLLNNAIHEHQFLMKTTDAERHMHTTARVTLFRDEKSFVKAAQERDVADELGVSYDVLDVDAFRDIEPSIKPNFYKVVRWNNSRRLDNPAAVTSEYAARFVREGGVLLIEDIQSVEIGAKDQWQVVTNQGTAEAARVVLCLGPWSKKITGALGYHFPMAPKRGYHQHFKAEGDAVLHHAITDAAWGYVMAPMEQGCRVTSGAEIVDLDEPPDPVQLARVLPHARELFPLTDCAPIPPWYGTRPCFADSRPVVGAAPRHPGLWFNFGHGHMGLTLGPATAHLLADLMTGVDPFCDPAPYRAERFRL